MKAVQLIGCCLLVATSIFMSCNQQDSSSAEHLKAIAWSESTEEIYEHLKARINDFISENEDFADAVWKSEAPDTKVLRRIKKHQTMIAKYKGILKKHEEILAQNRAYLEKHENAAISAKEIQTQHEQIYKNLLIIQEDATQISQQIDTILALYSALEKTLDT